MMNFYLDPDEEMTENKLFPEERKQRIIEMLKEQPKVFVADLAEEFGVSQFTVRADLDDLELEGKLRRCHGGALSVEKSGTVLDYDKRLARMAHEKKEIGRLAALLVDDGDSIAVDTGTTTLEMVRNINPDLHITIMTNDLYIVDLAEELLPNAKVLFLGGMVRRGFGYTTGSEVLWAMKKFRTDKAFVSTNGFTIEDGLTSEDPDQGQVKREYVKGAHRVFALFDSSKFGVVSFTQFAEVADIDGIVTDAVPEEDLLQRLRAINDHIELMVCSS